MRIVIDATPKDGGWEVAYRFEGRDTYARTRSRVADEHLPELLGPTAAADLIAARNDETSTTIGGSDGS